MLGYLRAGSLPKPLSACMPVRGSSWIVRNNNEAVVNGRMPTWKKIAWQLGKQCSPLAGFMVRAGVTACPCFLWVVWTCPLNMWHTYDYLLLPGPLRPPKLVVLSSVFSPDCNDCQPSLGDHEVFEGRDRTKPITIIASTSSICA